MRAVSVKWPPAATNEVGKAARPGPCFINWIGLLKLPLLVKGTASA